jgi:hypothetical protein
MPEGLPDGRPAGLLPEEELCLESLFWSEAGPPKEGPPPLCAAKTGMAKVTTRVPVKRVSNIFLCKLNLDIIFTILYLRIFLIYSILYKLHYLKWVQQSKWQ